VAAQIKRIDFAFGLHARCGIQMPAKSCASKAFDCASALAVRVAARPEQTVLPGNKNCR